MPSEKTKKGKTNLISWDEIYSRIDEIVPVLMDNLDIVNNFVAKIERNKKNIFNKYPTSSVVKAQVLAQLLDLSVGESCMCNYLVDHEDFATELGFKDVPIKSEIFRKMEEEIDRYGLRQSFDLMIEEIKKSLKKRKSDLKQSKETKPYPASRITVIVPGKKKEKTEEELKKEDKKIFLAEIREFAWDFYNDGTKKKVDEVTKVVEEKFGVVLDKEAIDQWTKEEIDKRKGRRCGDMECFRIPNLRDEWGWCFGGYDQRKKTQYICKKKI